MMEDSIFLRFLKEMPVYARISAIETLTEMSYVEKNEADCTMSGSSDILVKVLKELTKDEESRVREDVAKNPKTPAEVLKKLAKDGDWLVQVAAVDNPSFPKITINF